MIEFAGGRTVYTPLGRDAARRRPTEPFDSLHSEDDPWTDPLCARDRPP